MQTVSTRFSELAAGSVRPISCKVSASFDKSFDPGITFFTLNTSLLDGMDILAPSDDNPLQQWDQYMYSDYSDRLVSAEVTREETEPYSIGQAFADVTFNNYDGFFTPGGGSVIDTYILPKRPFRILLGFGGELVPQFVGMSEGMPTLDKKSGTARFHLLDFMSFLMNQDISETIILEDVKTHEVLDYLFQFMGLVDTQYTLDDSLNTIRLFYVEKGTKFKSIAEKLMEAEIGRLYMDETGVIRFKNRYSYDVTPVINFDKPNTTDYSLNDEVPIINSVIIKASIRDVQLSQSVWTGSSAKELSPGATAEIFAQFNDPVTTLTEPAYSATETNDSYYTATLNSDGTGAYSDVDLVSVDLFSTTAKMVFENTGTSSAYITSINLYGTPAKVIDTVKVEEIDQDSIDEFEEQTFEIDNEYIQDESQAQSRALVLLHDYAQYGSGLDVEVKGSPAIQIGDAGDVDLDGFQGIHTITKTVTIFDKSKLTNRYRLRLKNTPKFFILDDSVLDGSDLLSP